MPRLPLFCSGNRVAGDRSEQWSMGEAGCEPTGSTAFWRPLTVSAPCAAIKTTGIRAAQIAARASRACHATYGNRNSEI